MLLLMKTPLIFFFLHFDVRNIRVVWMELYVMLNAFRLNMREVFMIGANVKLCSAWTVSTLENFGLETYYFGLYSQFVSSWVQKRSLTYESGNRWCFHRQHSVSHICSRVLIVRGGKLACERIFIYSMLAWNAYICYQFQTVIQIF